jgi:transposase
MHDIERQVWREARAMTRREVITKAITKQLSWVQAAEIVGISPRHMRRLRRKVERWGMSAVIDQRGDRPRRKRIKAGTIELLCRLKRDVYGDFSLQHFYEHVTEKHGVKVSYNWLRLMLQEAGLVQKEPARGPYRRRRERRPMVGMLVHLDASTHELDRGPADAGPGGSARRRRRSHVVRALLPAGRYRLDFRRSGVGSAQLRPFLRALYRSRQPLLPQ